MSADNDFREALEELVSSMLARAAWSGEIADAVIALIARWEAKEPA